MGRWCGATEIQTAHLQTALLRLPTGGLAQRTQIRTAQLGSIRSTGLGMIAATQGKPEFTNCRSDLPMHLRDARLRWEEVMVMDNGDGVFSAVRSAPIGRLINAFRWALQK